MTYCNAYGTNIFRSVRDRNKIYLFTLVIHCIYLLIHCTVTNQRSVFVRKTLLFITGQKNKAYKLQCTHVLWCFSRIVYVNIFMKRARYTTKRIEKYTVVKKINAPYNSALCVQK